MHVSEFCQGDGRDIYRKGSIFATKYRQSWTSGTKKNDPPSWRKSAARTRSRNSSCAATSGAGVTATGRTCAGCRARRTSCCASTGWRYSCTGVFGMGMRWTNTFLRRTMNIGRRRLRGTRNGTRRCNRNWPKWDGTALRYGNAS